MKQVSLRYALCALCGVVACSTENSGDPAPQFPVMGAAGAPAMPLPPTMPVNPAMMPMNPVATPVAPMPMAGSAAPMPQQPMNPTTPPEMPPEMPTMPEEDWEVLVSADWELGPVEETTYCQRVTLQEDVYFKAIRALNPFGTHHTATTLGDPSGFGSSPDGLTRGCGSALSPQGIFGSGVGTDTVVYPPGVGMWLRRGKQILLNLHVYNTGTERLTGTSGVEIVKTTADEIDHAAESLLAGPALFSLPPGRQTMVSGTCTINADNTLFAVQPHMHQLGVHMKGVAHTAQGDVLLHDGPFDFEHQVVVPIEPLQMEQGDTIDITCTFDNTTDGTVSFGESSDTEMCFLVLHRYPAPDNPQVVCPF